MSQIPLRPSPQWFPAHKVIFCVWFACEYMCITLLASKAVSFFKWSKSYNHDAKQTKRGTVRERKWLPAITSSPHWPLSAFLFITPQKLFCSVHFFLLIVIIRMWSSFCTQFGKNTPGVFPLAISFSKPVYKAAWFFMQASVFSMFCCREVQTWLLEISHKLSSYSKDYLYGVFNSRADSGFPAKPSPLLCQLCLLSLPSHSCPPPLSPLCMLTLMESQPSARKSRMGHLVI